MQNAHESMQDGCDSRNTRKHGIPFDLLQFGEVYLIEGSKVILLGIVRYQK